MFVCSRVSVHGTSGVARISCGRYDGCSSVINWSPSSCFSEFPTIHPLLRTIGTARRARGARRCGVQARTLVGQSGRRLGGLWPAFQKTFGRKFSGLANFATLCATLAGERAFTAYRFEGRCHLPSFVAQSRLSVFASIGTTGTRRSRVGRSQQLSVFLLCEKRLTGNTAG